MRNSALATPDVTVFGGGIFGLSVAWACQKRGAFVRLIDPGGIAAGASGGTVGALAPYAPENWNDIKAFQLTCLSRAAAFWEQIEAASGLGSGFAPSGRLQPLNSADAIDRARKRGENARRLWQGAASWELREVRDFLPWAPGSETGLLVHDTLSARIDPPRACESLGAALRAGGAEILCEGEGEGAIVRATGWRGLAALSAELGLDAGGPVKGQSLLLRHEAPPDAPIITAPGLYIVPHEGGTLGIGSTSERSFDDPESTDAQLDALHERAVALMPALAEAPILRRFAGLRPRAAGGLPLLGPHPRRAGEFIANGGFGIGFAIAPEMGELLARLVLEGRDEIPPFMHVRRLFGADQRGRGSAPER